MKVGVRAVCTCWYLKCRWGHNESRRKSRLYLLVLKVSLGHKGHYAVMHKNKEVGERYSDATVSFGSVDLSDLARPGLEDAVRKTKKSRGVILAL